MESKTIQNNNLKIKEVVFQRLPKWCKVILELKQEIEKEESKSI